MLARAVAGQIRTWGTEMIGSVIKSRITSNVCGLRIEVSILSRKTLLQIDDVIGWELDAFAGVSWWKSVVSGIGSSASIVATDGGGWFDGAVGATILEVYCTLAKITHWGGGSR